MIRSGFSFPPTPPEYFRIDSFFVLSCTQPFFLAISRLKVTWITMKLGDQHWMVMTPHFVGPWLRKFGPFALMRLVPREKKEEHPFTLWLLVWKDKWIPNVRPWRPCQVFVIQGKCLRDVWMRLKIRRVKTPNKLDKCKNFRLYYVTSPIPQEFTSVKWLSKGAYQVYI